MWELRGCAAQWTVGAVLVLVGLAPLATAGGDAGELVVRGPLGLGGATALRADAPVLLLRGDGSAPADGFRVTLQAASVSGRFIEVREACLGPPVGLAALPPALDLPSPLKADRLLGFAPHPAEAAAAAPVVERVPAAVAQPIVLMATAAPSLPGPHDGAPCFSWPGGSRSEALDLTEASVEIAPADPGYLVFWDGTGGEGAATLEAGRAEARLLTEDEAVPLVDGETADSWSTAPRASIPAGLVEGAAGSGHGGFRGGGRLVLYRAEATITGLDPSGKEVQRVIRTGEHEDASTPGSTKRVLTYLDLTDVREASGGFDSPGPALLYGQELRADLDGPLTIPEARGTLHVGEDPRTYQGPALLEGPLQFTLRALDHHDAAGEHASEGAMLLAMAAPVAPTAIHDPPPPAEPASMATTAAAVGGVAVLAGLLAYFWPALKLLVAPLYTRIAPDAVLMHGARENIYRLIKQEPGIHAHEIAGRLTLGWGTTVYHLKLLERNGLVVPRHEGRYKRFFVTGDLHLQHQEAVALLRNRTSRAIASTVALRPGLIQKDVCQALGLSPSLASWHLQRLETAGVVRAERMGRSVRYQPGPAWVELQALAPAPVAQPAVAAPPAAALPPGPGTAPASP